jgi:hypothetical protein
MADGIQPRTALIKTTTSDTKDFDCETFRVTPQQWAAADVDQRSELMDGIEYCKLIDGKSRLDVQALIGAPDRESPGEIGYDLPVGEGGGADRKVWRIAFDDNGRVKSSVVESPTAP